MHRTAKYLYIIGGCSLAAEREPIRQIERIHVETVENYGNKFHIKIHSENSGQLSIARRSPSCFLSENREEIVVVGGCIAPNQHTNSMELLKIQQNLEEKFEVSTSQIDEKLNIGASCSGFDSYSSSPQKPIFGGFEAHNCLDDIQIVEKTNENSTWKCRKLGKKLLPKIKNSTVLEVKNGEFLMFGGWEDEQRTTKTIRKITFNEDFTDYTVDFAGVLPYPVEGHSCVRIGSNVLLIGGFDGCFVIDSIIKYNLETKKSEILDIKLQEKRENHVSAVLSDKYLVVAGGWNSRQSLDDVEVFEIKKSESIELARCQVDGTMLKARNRPSGVAI